MYLKVCSNISFFWFFVVNRSKGVKIKSDVPSDKIQLDLDSLTNEQANVSNRPHIIYDSSIEQLRITEERIQEVSHFQRKPVKNKYI